jgi:nitronate monooxygenase
MMRRPVAFDDLWEVPVVAAPMAGGPTTPDLVVAVSDAGGFAFLAAGYRPAADVEAQVREVRDRTSRPFGVNLFVPGAPTRDPSSVDTYARELGPEAARLGAELGRPRWDDDEWDAKLEVVLDAAPAVCSVAFGCPERRVVDALHQRGTAVVVTVTNDAEAEVAVSAGADAVCAQGIEAGAHRSTFDDVGADEQLPVLELVAAIRATTDVPVIAAGGMARPHDVHAALAAGVVAVQVGTAFLRCDESGASALHQAALVDPAFAETALTRAFTGRRARGLVNRFVRDHTDAPSAYPEVHHLTRPLRSASVARGDPAATNLWAGVNHRHARTGPAAAIVEWLAS